MNAIEEFLKAAKASRAFAKGYYDIARIYLLKGDKENFFKYFELALVNQFKNKKLILSDSTLNSVRATAEFDKLYSAHLANIR
jgi:hypothetical protein